MNFQDFFFSRLPYRFKKDDSYKVSGEGLLERYLRIFGLEINEEIKPYIDELLTEVDPTTCDAKFLNHISYTLGNPPDILDDVAIYRRFLATVVSLYKIKGTKPSYRLFFEILGYSVIIIEHPLTDPSLFDVSSFDSGAIFDATRCEDCSEYSLVFYPINADCLNPSLASVDQLTLDRIREFIGFNEPINAILRDLIVGLPVCDEIDACLSEEIEITLTTFTTFDSSSFDDGDTFDTSSASVTTINVNPC